MYRHGEEFGDGISWAENGKGSQYHLTEIFGPFWRIPATLYEKLMTSQLVVFVSVYYIFNTTELLILILDLEMLF